MMIATRASTVVLVRFTAFRDKEARVSGRACVNAFRHSRLTLITDLVNIDRVIESFKDRETRKIWNRQFSSRLPREIQRIAYRKLVIIHRSRSLNDLRVPRGNRLEALSGKRLGQYSIRINQQWRVCFRWENGRAVDVEIADYH